MKIPPKERSIPTDTHEVEVEVAVEVEAEAEIKQLQISEKNRNKLVKIDKIKCKSTPIYLNLHSVENFSVLSKGLNYAIPERDTRFMRLIDEGINNYLTRVNNSFLSNMARTSSFESKTKQELFKFCKLKKLIPENFFKQTKAPPHFKKIYNIIKKSTYRKKWNNLTNIQLQELNQLKNNKEIVLTKMDKSAGFVLLGKREYIRMGEKLFGDRENFEVMNPDFEPTDKLNQIRNLNNNIFRHLLSTHSVTQRMFEQSQIPCLNFAFTYLLIKNHKTLGEDNLFPVRPIVSANNTTFKFLDRYLELILYPLLSLIPSKIKNNTHLINKLKNIPFKENSQLASLDISNMYPSINQFQAASALELTVKENMSFLKEHVKDFKIIMPKPKYIKFLALIVMRNNIFSFNKKKFFQSRKGVAMGSNISVLLAEIFIWKTIETKLTLHHLNITLWGRYIDDIFILTHDTNFDPSKITNLLQTFSSLKFTSEGPNKTLNFLDIQIKNVDGHFVFQPYEKPTNTHAFLDFHSNHPPQVKKGIIVSKLHRIRDLSASNNIFQIAKSKFKTELLNRNYPSLLIDAQFSKVPFDSNKRKKEPQALKTNLEGIPLILPFDLTTQDTLKENLNKFKTLLKNKYAKADFIQSLLPRVIFKKSQTLSNILFKGRNEISKNYCF